MIKFSQMYEFGCFFQHQNGILGWQFCDIFFDMTADMVDGGSNPPF